ncbi:hypothetical protein GQ457_18G019670 [Hibiscus cannabinus]
MAVTLTLAAATGDGTTFVSIDDTDEHSFSNKHIGIRLDDTNFFLWKQQVILMMRGQGLEGYLDGSVSAPTKVLVVESGERTLNPAYVRFLQQNSSLASYYCPRLAPICYLGFHVSSIEQIAIILNGLFWDWIHTTNMLATYGEG